MFTWHMNNYISNTETQLSIYFSWHANYFILPKLAMQNSNLHYKKGKGKKRAWSIHAWQRLVVEESNKIIYWVGWWIIRVQNGGGCSLKERDGSRQFLHPNIELIADNAIGYYIYIYIIYNYMGVNFMYVQIIASQISYAIEGLLKKL